MGQLGGGIMLPEMAGRGEDLSVTTVALPLPPSVNGLFPGGRRRHKSAAYKAWEQEAALWVSRAVQPHPYRYGKLPIPPPGTRWSLHQFIFLADWRSDMDNRYKASIDFLCRLYRLNDRYLVQHSALRCTGKATGIVNVLGWE